MCALQYVHRKLQFIGPDSYTYTTVTRPSILIPTLIIFSLPPNMFLIHSVRTGRSQVKLLLFILLTIFEKGNHRDSDD